MTPTNPAWLSAFNAELLYLFAIDHQLSGTDSCWAATQTCRRATRRWRSAATTIWSATMRCGHGRDWRLRSSGDAFASLCIAALIASCRNWDSTTPKPCSVMPVHVAT